MDPPTPWLAPGAKVVPRSTPPAAGGKGTESGGVLKSTPPRRAGTTLPFQSIRALTVFKIMPPEVRAQQTPIWYHQAHF